MEYAPSTYLDHVFIDLSKRSIKLVESDGFFDPVKAIDQNVKK